MQAVILAGGEGIRLRPLTGNIPKPMVPLVNRPFLESMLEYLKRHGITEVLLATAYLPHKIRDYFGEGEGFGVRLIYSIEESPLGTAGAVKNLERHLQDTFVVFNGDVVTDMDLGAMHRLHRERGAAATLFLVSVEDPTRFGVVETTTEGRVTRFTEKPQPQEVRANTINGGCYILEPEVLAHIPESTFHMFEHGLFPKLLEMGARVYGHAPRAYWADVGTPASYLQVHRDILRGMVRGWGFGASSPPALHLGQGCEIDPTAILESPLVMGERCIVGPDARLAGTVVVGDGCKVGASASIRDAVLWHGVQVGERSELEGCIVGRGVSIGEGAWIGAGCVVGDGTTIGPGLRLGPGAAGAVLESGDSSENPLP